MDNKLEIERFEQWARTNVMSEQVIQDPPQGWVDSYSAFADLPHPNNASTWLPYAPEPGSLAYLRLGCDELYTDLGGEG